MGLFAGQAWFWMAISAALLWGVGYNLSEFLMKKGITPIGLMLANTLLVLPLYIALFFRIGKPAQDFAIMTQDKGVFLALLLAAVTVMGGNLLILSSVASKNASLASLIEISYPLFVIFFAWLAFREVQVNAWTAVGGAMILAGVAVIYLKN